jgi:hypothetical protein
MFETYRSNLAENPAKNREIWAVQRLESNIATLQTRFSSTIFQDCTFYLKQIDKKDLREKYKERLSAIIQNINGNELAPQLN